MPLSPKFLSFRRSVLFFFLFLALLASAVYLHERYEIEVPSELEIALSSIREDCNSWISRIGPSTSWNGGSSSGDLWQDPFKTSGLVPSEREDSDRNSPYAVSDPASSASSSPSTSPILNFDSSVSTSLFRTWGTLTFQGGSTLSYLILNATLWQDDRPVESTRYMMMEVEPGKGRDFDIRESCRLSPERNYSCLLEVEEPEGLFVSERRDCLVAEDDSGVVIWDGSGAARGREAAPEKGSADSPLPSAFAKTVSSSSSKSTAAFQEVEDSPDDLELEGEDRSSDSSSGDLESEDEDLISDSSSGDQKKTETEVGTDYEDYQLDEDYYVGSATSDKYHRADCSYAKKIKPENRIIFSDVWEAREAGYSPCKVCNPQ